MQRRRLIQIVATLGLLASQAVADGVADQITRQLRDQGFGQVTITQTWLGRTRIIGTSGDGQREIILNPRTGEILRDLFTASEGNSATPAIGNPVVRNATASPDSDDDDDDNGGSGSGSGDDNAGSEEDDDTSAGSDDDDGSDSENDDDSDDDGDNSGSEDDDESGNDDDDDDSGNDDDSGGSDDNE